MAAIIREAINDLKRAGLPVVDYRILIDKSKVPAENYNTDSGKVENILDSKEVLILPDGLEDIEDTFKVEIERVPLKEVFVFIGKGNGFMRIEHKAGKLNYLLDNINQRYVEKIRKVMGRY